MADNFFLIFFIHGIFMKNVFPLYLSD